MQVYPGHYLVPIAHWTAQAKLEGQPNTLNHSTVSSYNGSSAHYGLKGQLKPNDIVLLFEMTYSCALWVFQTSCLFPGQTQARHVVIILALIVLRVHLTVRRFVQAYAADVDKRVDLWRRFDGIRQRFCWVDARVPNILLEAGSPASGWIQYILTRGINHRAYGARYAILFEFVPGDAFSTRHARYNGYFISILGQVFGQMTANKTGTTAWQREPQLTWVFTHAIHYKRTY